MWLHTVARLQPHLISLARTSLGYPADFYGYIPLEIGSASAVILKKTGLVQWIGVNIHLSELEKRLVFSQIFDDG